jgi:hypothetical protein
MKSTLLTRRALTIFCVAGASAVLAPAASASVFDPSTCSAQPESQAFLTWGDDNWYTPVPGQGADGFDGTGWTLSGGAQIATTTLADGSTGQVLDLPSGSSAISPVACVTSDFPKARTMIRDVAGNDNVSYSVSYAESDAWSAPGNEK